MSPRLFTSRQRLGPLGSHPLWKKVSPTSAYPYPSIRFHFPCTSMSSCPARHPPPPSPWSRTPPAAPPSSSREQARPPRPPGPVTDAGRCTPGPQHDGHPEVMMRHLLSSTERVGRALLQRQVGMLRQPMTRPTCLEGILAGSFVLALCILIMSFAGRQL